MSKRIRPDVKTENALACFTKLEQNKLALTQKSNGKQRVCEEVMLSTAFRAACSRHFKAKCVLLTYKLIRAYKICIAH